MSPSSRELPASDLGHAAIDVELCARDIARLVRREERNSFGDLVWISQPAERNIILHLFLHYCEGSALLETFHDRSIDVARAEDVHADATVSQVIRPGPSKGTNRRLGGAVHTHGGKTLDIGNRSIQDDCPTVLHQREAFLDGEEQTLDVRVEVKVEKFLLHGAKGR